MSRLLFIVVLAVALALAGCGSGGDSAPKPLASPGAAAGASGPAGAGASAVSEVSPTARRALARLDEICFSTERALRFQINRELGPAAERKKTPPTRARLQHYYDDVVIPARRDEYELLRKIDVPAVERPAVNAYLDAFAAATRELGADLALIKNPGIERTAYDQANAKADEAGLRRCANPFAPTS